MRENGQKLVDEGHDGIGIYLLRFGIVGACAGDEPDQDRRACSVHAAAAPAKLVEPGQRGGRQFAIERPHDLKGSTRLRPTVRASLAS
jgi:hypothetical protein